MWLCGMATARPDYGCDAKATEASKTQRVV